METRWDVFCRVVDNFGDVGVSWRLARALAADHGKQVRLWLDDFTVLAKLRPEIDPRYDVQSLEGVEVVRLREPFAVDYVADVVVETFGCDPPVAYVEAMARRDPKPRWINLEYLSAEDWVEGSHGLPSPNPRLPLVKHYFFPGFSARTGGLLRERSLLARRDAFQSDGVAQDAFWHEYLGRTPPRGALKLSLFGYAGAPFDALARACSHLAGPVWVVAPEGAASTALQSWAQARQDGIRRNDHAGGARRELEVFTPRFLPQDRYDCLLWACDLNFVRGEDSFVRAQWAGKPFVWNIYPTEDGAHWVKMAAFLGRYTQALDRSAAEAVAALWKAWNRREGEGSGPSNVLGNREVPMAEALPAFAARLPALTAHAGGWAKTLAAQHDLASALVDFADNVLT
jgi:uncharacterized repeat protein (TIGR03837 family)